MCVTSQTHFFVSLLQSHRVMDLLVLLDLLVFAFLPIRRRNNRLRAHEGGGKICFQLLPVLKYVSPVCERIYTAPTSRSPESYATHLAMHNIPPSRLENVCALSLLSAQVKWMLLLLFVLTCGTYGNGSRECCESARRAVLERKLERKLAG